MPSEPVALLFAEDMPTVRQALAYVADERLVDLCNALGLKLSEAENLRDRCAELLAGLE